MTAQYGDRAEGGVSVENTQYWPGEDRYEDIQGYALANNWFPGWINVFFFFDFGADYRVIDTDYDSYAIIYSCTQYGPVTYPEYSWLLVRSQIEEGSAAYTSMMSTVDPIYETKLPNYDRATRMRTT